MSDLKEFRLEQFWMSVGREFLVEGAAMEEALSPQVWCLVLTCGEIRFA